MEPLVVPSRIAVYIEERNAPPAKAVFYSRIPFGLDYNAVSHIILFFGWAPAISKMTPLGSNAKIVYTLVNIKREDMICPINI